MPELPEVEQARKLFARVCVGRHVVKCAVEQDFKVFDGVAPNEFARHLLHQRVTGAGRKGKQLWVELEKRPWALIHLGMTGSFAAIDARGDVHTAHYVNSNVDASCWPPKHWKFHIELDDGGKVAFIAIRRFERVRLLHDPPSESPVKDLGFDPLTAMMPLGAFADVMQGRSGPVKGALLDQHFCAGVGNWIADEVLYQARVHPETPSSRLSQAQAAAIHTQLQLIVKTACDAEAESARFPGDWLFHFRWTGKAASRTFDGKPIAFSTVAGRTTAWVPSVQRKTDDKRQPIAAALPTSPVTPTDDKEQKKRKTVRAVASAATAVPALPDVGRCGAISWGPVTPRGRSRAPELDTTLSKGVAKRGSKGGGKGTRQGTEGAGERGRAPKVKGGGIKKMVTGTRGKRAKGGKLFYPFKEEDFFKEEDGPSGGEAREPGPAKKAARKTRSPRGRT